MVFAISVPFGTEQEVGHVSRQSRRSAWIFVAVLALAVIAPGIVYAATGTFTSSSSTTALTAKNSSSGRAINATSNTGYTGVFTRSATSGTTPTVYAINKSNTNGALAMYGYSSATGTGSTYGVYGRSNTSGGRGVYGFAAKTSGLNYGVYGRTVSATNDASGVFGWASAATGLTNGVFGQASSEDGTGLFGVAPGLSGFGVFGLGGALGVFGAAGTPGDGSYGVVSNNDFGTGGHIVSTVGQVAGTCTVVAATSSKTCDFTNPFYTGVTPIVVITPTEDPLGIVSWVSGATTTGFTITPSAAPGADLTYNYVVVGTQPVPAAAFESSTLR